MKTNIETEHKNENISDFNFDDFLVKKCLWHLNMNEEEKINNPHKFRVL